MPKPGITNTTSGCHWKQNFSIYEFNARSFIRIAPAPLRGVRPLSLAHHDKEPTRDAQEIPSEFLWFGTFKPTENGKLKILHALQAESGQ